MRGMRNAIKVMLVLGILLVAVQGQPQSSSPIPPRNNFVGCYEVVSLESAPPKQPAGGIPHRFELTDRATIFGNEVFQLSAETAATPPARLHHVWSPLQNRVMVQFGWGMGGWKGKLKQLKSNELAGKLKPFCDTIRCGDEVVTIRAKRVDCAK